MDRMITQETKVIQAIPPQHSNVVTATGEYVCLKNYDKMTIIIEGNNLGAAGTQDFHLYCATDVAGTGQQVDQNIHDWWLAPDTTVAAPHALGLNAGGAPADLLVKGAVDVTLVQLVVAQTMQLIVIEVDPREYPGYDCFCVKADAGNALNYYSAIYILHGARYQQAAPPAAVTD